MAFQDRGLGVLVLAAGLALGACGGGGDAEAATTAAEGTEPAAFVREVNVEVEMVRQAPFTEYVTVTGSVQANRDVVVAAEESGVIRRLYVDRGAVVGAGQAIAKIDDGVLSAQVDQARAAAELAQTTYERRKALWENEKIGSEIAYLEARSNAAQAAANLATLEQRLARTVVRAPFAGFLEDRRVELGSAVVPGTPVARIVDTSPVKVLGAVPERFAADVNRGREVSITFDALDAVVDGTVSFVGAAVDDRSRTFPIEVRVENRDGRFKPEMSADIRLPLRVVENAIVVPQDALIRDEDGFVVYVAVPDGDAWVAEVREVETGAADGGRIVIESGVEAGDRVIVLGHRRVSDGDRVNVIDDTGAVPVAGPDEVDE
ncbi:MAG TPA: efflux RND transporter periplasmic adaptor subunit [Longimicrobiales bacterium]|nr:efflux RND transporter periplasmic adaptor subunit [Longimicrobiales bacterium]